MSFIRVQTLFLGNTPNVPVIINTDKIRYIYRGPNGLQGARVYYVQYDGTNSENLGSPYSFDRANAEIIFNALGVWLD